MKFGYMSGFRADLFSEIEFAQKHFDFTEITIQPKLLKTVNNICSDLKGPFKGFEILGHIHWEITDFKNIIKNIEALKILKVKKITIHPFQDLTVEENAKIFNEVNVFLQKNKMELLIENVSSPPYNSADAILELIKKIPGANITLDIGHANRIFELDKFINIFDKKIHHIHAHNNIGELDHIFYNDKRDLTKLFLKIKSFNYNGTVLLETFSIMENGKNNSQEFGELKNLHIEQLGKIKN